MIFKALDETALEKLIARAEEVEGEPGLPLDATCATRIDCYGRWRRPSSADLI